MKRIFLSADIEGTCGIIHWDETEKTKADYPPYARQMTREVAAACEGALAGGAEEVLVKDAHDSARNIDAEQLPRKTKLLRGWAQDLCSMMVGLTGEFDGVIFTGYHSAAGIDGNPLSHTMNTKNVWVKINGELASEMLINSLYAATLNVPVLMLAGDKALCDWAKSVNPDMLVVPVKEGIGRASLSIHPDEAVDQIRAAAAEAMTLDSAACVFPLPEHFVAEICFREHASARNARLYPGVVQTDARTVKLESDDYTEVLRFFYFCL